MLLMAMLISSASSTSCIRPFLKRSQNTYPVLTFLGYVSDFRGAYIHQSRICSQSGEGLAPLFICQVTASRHLMSVLSHMACREKIVPPDRLHMRPLISSGTQSCGMRDFQSSKSEDNYL